MDPIRRIIPVKRGFKKFQRRAIVTAFCIGRNIQYVTDVKANAIGYRYLAENL